MARSPRLDGATLADALVNVARAGTRISYPDSDTSISGPDLLAAARRFAHELLASGVQRGDVVGILDVTAPSFLVSFFGATLAGAAASPLPTPPLLSDPQVLIERIARVIRSAEMRTVAIAPVFNAISAGLAAKLPRLVIVTSGDGRPGGPLPRTAPDDLAIVQFTSGSTGNPKGISLTQHAVMAGLRSAVISGEFSPDDVYVQWVPHFHDMGLIGFCTNFLNGADIHLLSPVSFLRSPARLLQYMSENGGTVMAGPDFSYARMAEAADAGAADDLDLRSWRLAVNGAEPVRAATVRAFTRALEPAGLRPSVMFPAYGMAEATLCVCFPQPGSVPRVIAVDRAALTDHGIVQSVPGTDLAAKELVSVGGPVHGLDLRIVNADAQPCLDGQMGEIQIAGPAVTSGYYRDETVTAERFDGPWLRTGDLGIRLGPDVFLTGRRKELIIVYGQNYFPEDVEAVVRGVPGVFRGRCVAFGDSDADESEYATVVVEAPRHADPEPLCKAVARRVAIDLDLHAVRVRVVPPHWLSRTTSGKWQRALARERLVNEEMTGAQAEPEKVHDSEVPR